MYLWQVLVENLEMLGQVVCVPNKKRILGPSEKYFAVPVSFTDPIEGGMSPGAEDVLLFTADEIEIARERATRNPDDIVKYLTRKKVLIMRD